MTQTEADDKFSERRSLPAWSAKDRLVEIVKENPVTLVVGETGSGKTTQIPQFLYEAGFAKNGIIACTQPRRVAAVTVARRVSEEMGVTIGGLVGYSVRFDDCTSPETRIKYMTDGMLLREALLDPLLKKYKVVLLDEAHERTVATDVLLGLLKAVQARRGKGFHLLIMSATLATEGFTRYFPGCKATYIQGRQYHVDVLYTATPQDSYLDAALTAALQIHVDEDPGDILVFLTGQDEIESCERLLKERAAALPSLMAIDNGDDGQQGGSELLVLPIYAALPPEAQMKVFQPAPQGTRKVILATNIAETSITISGIRYVVDTGVVKTRAFSPKLGADCLQVTPISQAQARQRSGRAGREAPGKAFRLYTEGSFRELPSMQEPEIKRSNLASVVLQLKALGIENPLTFDFMDPPPKAALLRAMELLYALGALDDSGQLTEHVGKSLSRLPVDPMYGRVLLASIDLGCSDDILGIVAMISTDATLLHTPSDKREESKEVHKRFYSKLGDHLTMLAVFKAYIGVPKKERGRWCRNNFCNNRGLQKAVDIYTQLRQHVEYFKKPISSSKGDEQLILKALVSGLFPNAAIQQPDGTYRGIASGQLFHVHPSSVMHNKKAGCLVFNELVKTSRQYARGVSSIDANWLAEVAPSYFTSRPVVV